MLVIYSFFNSLLFTNYYITSKSTYQVMNYLKKEKILVNTNPGVITPHVHHLYDNCAEFKHSKKCDGYIKGNIKIASSDYTIVYYKKDSLFSSNIKLLGFDFKKYSVIKNN